MSNPAFNSSNGGLSWMRFAQTETLQIRENEPLAPLTTLHVGGPARWLVETHSDSDVVEAFKYAAERNLEVFVLGGGSNILVSDHGFNGLVIRISNKGIVGR